MVVCRMMEFLPLTRQQPCVHRFSKRFFGAAFKIFSINSPRCLGGGEGGTFHPCQCNSFLLWAQKYSRPFKNFSDELFIKKYITFLFTVLDWKFYFFWKEIVLQLSSIVGLVACETVTTCFLTNDVFHLALIRFL